MSCSDSEKRKSNKSGNMGDVLGKECGDSEKDEKPQESLENYVREEADGAPSVDEQSSQSSGDTESEDSRQTDEIKSVDGEMVPADGSLSPTPVELGRPLSPNLIEEVKQCTCDSCRGRRQMVAEHEEELLRLRSYWEDLRQFIRQVYHMSMEGQDTGHDVTEDSNPKIKDLVHKLCARDPHQLFKKLERLVRDFVVEEKVRHVEIIQQEQTSELARVFITSLLDSYDKLCQAAKHLTPFLEQLEKDHLQRFDLTWELFNKHLYLSCVYMQPLVQNNLPHYIAKLRNMLPGKNQIYCLLVHRYLAFDDEMTLIGAMWKETQANILKYNDEQASRKAKERMLQDDWELFRAQRRLIKQTKWSKAPNEYDEQLMSYSSLGCFSGSPESLGDNAANAEQAPKENGTNYCVGCPCDECAVTHLLTCGGLMTPPDSPHSYGPKMIEELRMEGEGSEEPPTSPSPPSGTASADAGEGTQPQSCECHVCTGPPMTPIELVENYECHTCVQQPVPIPEGTQGINHNLHTGGFHLYPHIHGTGGAGEPGNLYPHLYNIHPSLLTQLGSKHSRLGAHLPDHLQHDQTKAHLIASQIQANLSQARCPPSSPSTAPITAPTATPNLPSCQQKQPCKTLVDGIVASITSALPKGGLPCREKVASIVQPQSSMSTQTSPKKGKTVLEKMPSPSPPALARQPPPILPVAKRAPHSIANMHHHHPPPRPSSVRNSTTQTAGHTHGHTCQPLPDVVKSAAHRPLPGNKPTHTCHKGMEPIKRVACAEYGEAIDGEDSSSQDDTCSERSSSTTTSTQRDSRHCDCCYCEVFGHGMPSVAPVSRNYQEMRERLRLLLTKKKAKCKVVQGAVPNSVNKAGGPPQPGPPGSKPSAQETVPKSGCTAVVGQKAQSTAAPTPLTKHDSLESLLKQPTKDPRDLEALLDFIEGNQSKKCLDSKKAAKRARQKQKKQEEKEKKEQEDAERQRLEEIRTKNPEVTITVVNPPPGVTNPQPKGGKAGKNVKKAELVPLPTDVSISKKSTASVKNTSTGSQMVTIKRVIEPNSEPTVTITLKGATPDKDKVLFTLVNGQGDFVCQPHEGSRSEKQTPSQKMKISNQGNLNNAKASTNGKKKKGKGVKEGKELEQQSQNSTINKSQHSMTKVNNTSAKSNAIPPKSVTVNTKLQSQKVNSIPNNRSERKSAPSSSSHQPANQSPAITIKKNNNPTPADKMGKNRTPVPPQVKPPVAPSNVPVVNSFSLDNFKLPPGITITKVEGPTPVRRPQPKPVEQPKSTIIQNKYSTTVIADPSSHRIPDMGSMVQGGGGNYILVDTARMKEELEIGAITRKNEEDTQSNSSNGKKKGKKKNKNGNQELGNNSENGSNGNHSQANAQNSNGFRNLSSLSRFQQPLNSSPQSAIIKVNGSMVTIRNPAFYSAMSDGNRFQQPSYQATDDRAEVVINGDNMGGKKSGKGQKGNSAAPVNGIVKGKENYVTPPRFANAEATLRSRLECNGGSVQITKVPPTLPTRVRQQQSAGRGSHGTQLEAAEMSRAQSAMHEAIAAANDAKKKKKKKKGTGAQGKKPDEWHLADNVFAPKDIDLENVDIDDDERELEAFKRFCFDSVPRKQKEKVHLNIKDIVLKKKSSAIGCS